MKEKRKLPEICKKGPFLVELEDRKEQKFVIDKKFKYFQNEGIKDKVKIAITPAYTKNQQLMNDEKRKMKRDKPQSEADKEFVQNKRKENGYRLCKYEKDCRYGPTFDRCYYVHAQQEPPKVDFMFPMEENPRNVASDAEEDEKNDPVSQLRDRVFTNFDVSAPGRTTVGF